MDQHSVHGTAAKIPSSEYYDKSLNIHKYRLLMRAIKIWKLRKIDFSCKTFVYICGLICLQ